MFSVLLITTGQPATNPRIVKEATALQAAGYDTTILYCYFISWAANADELLLKTVAWKYQMAGGSPTKKKAMYFLTKLRFKIAKFLNHRLGNNLLLAERTQARAYDELLSAAKKIKADWYIGHNLGALAVAVNAAIFNGAKAGFDFEDYHRGEVTTAQKKELKRMIYLENKYIPFVQYYSTSSSLITNATQKNHPRFKGNIITLLNCFPLRQQPAFNLKNKEDHTLKLFWFSQTIGVNRGLEVLIAAMLKINDLTIHLTLAGRCNDDMLQYIKTHAGKLITNIHFAGIIQPEELPLFASQFDVGMAMETGFSENNNIALSNKIFTYLLAGNAIILSNTPMQAAFNNAYRVGECYPINNENELASKIILYQNNNKLNDQKLYNYELAKNQLNWENESKTFLTNLSET